MLLIKFSLTICSFLPLAILCLIYSKIGFFFGNDIISIKSRMFHAYITMIDYFKGYSDCKIFVVLIHKKINCLLFSKILNFRVKAKYCK